MIIKLAITALAAVSALSIGACFASDQAKNDAPPPVAPQPKQTNKETAPLPLPEQPVDEQRKGQDKTPSQKSDQ